MAVLRPTAPVRLPLAGLKSTRDADANTKDYRLVNAYIERVGEGRIRVIKRPGLKADTTIDATATASRGVWSDDDYVWTALDDAIWRDTTELTTISLSTSSGRMYFDKLEAGTDYIVASDLANLYYITGTTIAKVTDGDFPGTHVPYPVVFDGYTFVMDGDGTIWNSANEDPSSWASTDFITAEMTYDKGVALIRYNNYLVAFGSQTYQMFYDAANASNSPLSKVEGTEKDIGCASGHTVVKVDNTIIWVGQTRGAGKKIYRFSGLDAVVTSTPAIDKLLDEEADNITTAYAYNTNMQGHSFYVLELTTSAITLVYDLVENAWHEWTYYNGSSEGEFLVIGATSDANKSLMLKGGKLYSFDPDTYQDISNTIKVKGQTDRFDGGTNQNKILNRLEVIGNYPTSTANMSILWSDDDYQNFTSGRTVDLSSRPLLTRCGRFQRRAFQWTYENNLPMELEAFELDIEPGDYGQ